MKPPLLERFGRELLWAGVALVACALFLSVPGTGACEVTDGSWAGEPPAAAPVDLTQSLHAISPSPPGTPSRIPVYRIPLRVHLGKSGRPSGEFRPILDEINEIWWRQAGICFEIEAVLHDSPMDGGIDLWFLPVLGSDDSWNGVYRSDRDIQVRDTPLLGAAAHSARSPAARTAAHELGHALDLPHRQDSDSNLMRSKTYGSLLNVGEILRARKTAALKGLPDTAPLHCGPPRIAGD